MSGAVRLDLTERSGLRCCNITRSDTIALNVVLAVLRRDISCKHFQSALCSCVCRYGLTAELTHHRADVDDLSMTLLNHSWNDCLGYNKRCVQVNIDDLSELGRLHLKHRNTFDDSCIVDKNVDRSDFLLDLCHHGFHLLLVCHVADITVCLDALLFIGSKSLVHKFLPDVVEYDCCACLCECSCDCKTDSVRCACYKCNFTLE